MVAAISARARWWTGYESKMNKLLYTLTDYISQVADEAKGDARIAEVADLLGKAQELLGKITG